MQLTYGNEPAIGRAGMLADARILKHTASRLAVGSIKAGLGVFRVPGYGQPGAGVIARPVDPGQVYQTPSPAIAVDVDAFFTTVAGAAGGVTVLAAAANGVHGNNPMLPARNITVTTAAHADHDADADGLVITYYNQEGTLVSETKATADMGGETHTTLQKASRLVSVAFAADSMSGAGATFTVGVTVLDTIDLADMVGVAQYDAAHEPGVQSRVNAATGAGISTMEATYEYADLDTVPVLVKGAIWVVTEDACVAGAAAYVRIGAGAGGSQLGAFRSDADTATAVAITGARWGKDSGVGGLNILELY